MFAHPLCFALGLALCAATGTARSTQRDIVFLGFARNEAATAWQIQRSLAFADGSRDSYSLIRLLGVDKQDLLATFVAAPLRHRPAANAPPLSAAQLRARHPDFYRAASAAAWHKVRRSGHFAYKTHEFGDVTVRVGADQDSALVVEGDKEKKRLKLRTKDSGPLGFTPIVRLFEGEMVPLGHFRQAPAGPGAGLPAPLRAELRVYYSASGRLIAGLNTFYGGDGRRGPSDAVILVTPQDSPIGATGVGLLQMVESQSRSVYNKFHHLHPARSEAFRHYVGKWF